MPDRSDEARRRAEANFKKKEQQAQEAEKVWAERAVAEKATEQNAARLKALRLARETLPKRRPRPAQSAKGRRTLKRRAQPRHPWKCQGTIGRYFQRIGRCPRRWLGLLARKFD